MRAYNPKISAFISADKEAIINSYVCAISLLWYQWPALVIIIYTFKNTVL